VPLPGHLADIAAASVGSFIGFPFLTLLTFLIVWGTQELTGQATTFIFYPDTIPHGLLICLLCHWLLVTSRLPVCYAITCLLNYVTACCHVADDLQCCCPSVILAPACHNAIGLPLHSWLAFMLPADSTTLDCLYIAGLPLCHWPASFPLSSLQSSQQYYCHHHPLSVPTEPLHFSLYN
jgi:hypothetical protein